jgi:hypothetical protein
VPDGTEVVVIWQTAAEPVPGPVLLMPVLMLIPVVVLWAWMQPESDKHSNNTLDTCRICLLSRIIRGYVYRPLYRGSADRFR